MSSLVSKLAYHVIFAYKLINFLFISLPVMSVVELTFLIIILCTFKSKPINSKFIIDLPMVLAVEFVYLGAVALLQRLFTGAHLLMRLVKARCNLEIDQNTYECLCA